MPERHEDRLFLADDYVGPVRVAPPGFQWRLVCDVCRAIQPTQPPGPGCVACELRKGA